MPVVYPLHALKSFIIYVLMGVSLIACGGGGGGSSSPIVSLDSLALSAISTALKVNETATLSLTATYSNATTELLSSGVTWSSANASIAQVSATGVVTGKGAGSTTITASFQGKSAQTTVNVKALASLSLSPTSATLNIGSSQALSVSGLFSDNSVYDGTVTWSSSNSSIASVSSSGNVLAVSAGSVTITAASGSVSQSATITVLPDLESLSLTTVGSTLKVGETFQLGLTGNYSDLSTQSLTSSASWSVANEAVLQVNSSGLITAFGAGTTTITANYGGLSAQINVSVKALASLSISPSSLTLAKASSKQLQVTGIYSDNSSESFDGLVNWTTSNNSIASISSSGLLSAIDEGNAVIQASSGSVSASLNVTVTPALLQSILVSSTVSQVAAGLNTQYSAQGVYSDGSQQDLSSQVSWGVSNDAIATIDSSGLLTALQAGSVTVSASKDGFSGSAFLTVTSATLSSISIAPSQISLAKGTQETVIVTAIFTDSSKQDVSTQVTWSNTDDSIATIDSSSIVSALTQGSTSFTATFGGESADLLVTVTNEELVSISVSPENVSLPLGRSQQFTAQGTYTDGSVQNISAQVTWLSDDESLVLVSNNQSTKGLAESLAEGTTNIMAVLGDVQQSTSITIENAVLESIELTPDQQTLANGTDAQVSAQGYYSDGSIIDISADVVWSTKQPNLVDLSSAANGIIHTLNVGSALISADLDGVSGLGSITVTNATLDSIQVSAEQTSVANGMSLQLLATGTYSDASTKNITQQVSWTSSDPSIGTIANAQSGAGLFSANSVGQVSLSASLGGVSGNLTVDVTNAVLTSLAVSSSVNQINIQTSTNLTATATYSDSSTQNVSSQVNWLSSNTAIATVANTLADKGKLKGIAIGNVTISASLNGITSADLAMEVILNPDLPKSISVKAQPNIILNNNTDSSQVTMTLVPSLQSGSIADGTPVVLTIKEGASTRTENLTTTNGAVTYSLQSTYNGFISLSASGGGYTASALVLSTNDFTNGMVARGQSSVLYENDTLRAGSTFYIFLRNLSNRVYTIDRIEIGYLDPNNGNTPTEFSDSPITASEFISGGDLKAGEFTYIGYQLDSDVEASVYIVNYIFTDPATGVQFPLTGLFNFGP